MYAESLTCRGHAVPAGGATHCNGVRLPFVVQVQKDCKVMPVELERCEYARVAYGVVRWVGTA